MGQFSYPAEIERDEDGRFVIMFPAGGPISGTGLSSGIMRLAHGFPVAANGRVSRAVAPGRGHRKVCS